MGLAAALLVLGSSTLAGCGASGSSQTPAICSDVTALKTSVDDLKKVDVTKDGLSALKTGLTR